MTRRATPLTFLALGVLALAACHQETPPLAMAETNTVGTTVPADDASDGDDASAGDDEDEARDLWFAGGPGREAILARERRDHARAVELLDEVLADEHASARERCGAELLRGLEAVRVDDHAGAATHFHAARQCPALTKLEPRLRLLEAQALLDAHDAEAALGLVAKLEPSAEAGIPVELYLIRADAEARTDAREAAIGDYERFLAEADDRKRHEARHKLAKLLLDGDADDQRKAAEQLERIVTEVPLSDYGDEAKAELAKLEKAKIISRTKAEKKRLRRLEALAEIERELGQRDYDDAIAAADKVLAQRSKLGLDGGDRCRVLYWKGSAIFKQRKRSAAQPVFDEASEQCVKAGDVTHEVKSRYQAARGVYAAGKYSAAAGRFEQLAQDRADHSYADDCLIKAGESWESAGKPAEARADYELALTKHPSGDMYGEALRRLLVQAFAESRPEDALALTEAEIAKAKVRGDELAKLHYFRGKALDRLARGDEAEDAWLDAVAVRPLGYPALQACSRLRERGDEVLARALAAIEAASEATPPKLELPATPMTERAAVWASLGLGEQALGELEAAEVNGWQAVAILNRAGLYNEAQRKLANLGSGWRESGPGGPWRTPWELAHPAPFRGLVSPGETTHGVPELLTYAIMQSESRFNPGATSWAGARGLIQLMPGTAEDVARKAGLDIEPSQLYDPATNLDIGQRYLAGLTARWGNVDGAAALAVPSYNAGPGRTDDWLDERGAWDLDLFIEAIPFDETRRYTQSVLGRWATYRWLYGDGDGAARMPYIPLQIPPRAQ